MRLSKKITALLMCAVMLASAMAGCGPKPESTEKAAAKPAPVAETQTAAPVRNVREGIQTVLAVTLSDFETAEASGFRNGSQADMLMLLVVDETLGRTTALQVNPDTMVPFTAPGTSEEIQIPVGQIYSYGSGGSDSCLSLRKAVSQLLGGLEIDHYMIFSQGAIGIIGDVLGGLEVEVPEDFSEKYPELSAGETARLTGEQADAFFGYRDASDVSNQLHMARQQQFLTAVYGPFTEKIQNDDFLTKLTMKLGDRLNTDLVLSQMVQLMEVMEASELVETIVTLPEHAAEDEVQQILEDLLY